jgi:hypothetical protein
LNQKCLLISTVLCCVYSKTFFFIKLVTWWQEATNWSELRNLNCDTRRFSRAIAVIIKFHYIIEQIQRFFSLGIFHSHWNSNVPTYQHLSSSNNHYIVIIASFIIVDVA